ncbi:hypothetical protein K0M31_018217 [Melipona bicolor]|uniref:Uncharacterized protein n=1 Tax=Melipona bicolor TaxID=60889 RepID=A0AA40KDT0_9HYME|nr:hypothetical protein K0M31_018217 [Melipona bicolor]
MYFRKVNSSLSEAISPNHFTIPSRSTQTTPRKSPSLLYSHRHFFPSKLFPYGGRGFQRTTRHSGGHFPKSTSFCEPKPGPEPLLDRWFRGPDSELAVHSDERLSVDDAESFFRQTV